MLSLADTTVTIRYTQHCAAIIPRTAAAAAAAAAADKRFVQPPVTD